MAPGDKVGRRSLLRGLPAAALAVGVASARGETVGLAVTCDTTLAPALRELGTAYRARSGVPVFVFPTGPGLILPQLLRDIQNDIVVTQVAILDQATQAGVVAPTTRGKTWHNPLVVAGVPGTSAIDRTIAVSDPSPASDIDGAALLARLGLHPAHVLGAVDTDEVAFLLTTGAAQAGLLHVTDVRADQRLEIIRPVPADISAPIVYSASVTRLARRPNPQDFIAFLATSEADRLLSQSGIEVHA
jgi:molybdate transport system substrate-binding protein